MNRTGLLTKIACMMFHVDVWLCLAVMCGECIFGDEITVHDTSGSSPFRPGR